MARPIWVIIILVLAITGFDAARPYLTGDIAERAAGFNERTEFWSFVAFVAVLCAALAFRKYRSRK